MMFVVQELPMPEVSNVFYPFNSSLEEEIRRLFENFTIEAQTTTLPSVEDVMEEFRHNGRDFEYCPDSENVKSPEVLYRRKKNKKPSPTECVFCKNNGEKETYYKKHWLKDDDGKVRCPVLRAYICPLCGATGDNAHTIKYCNKTPKTDSSAMATANTFRFLRNSIGRRRNK
ncbi:RNA-binding protein nanos [Augochlora pura]